MMKEAEAYERKVVQGGIIVGIASILGMSVLGTYAFGAYAKAAPDSQIAAVSKESDPFSSITLEAKSAYVYDLKEGHTVFELNADIQLPLASVTKIPLVLSAAEVLSPSEEVRVSREAVLKGEGGGLGTGDTWQVGDLIDFTLAASSNAGAELLAEVADKRLRAKYPAAPMGGAAVWRMNQIAHELGLTKTYFLNPSGLDISDTQAGAMSSAREAASLMVAASEMSALFAGTTEYDPYIGPLNGVEKGVRNTNDALPEIPGLVIGKTGYTDLAGGNLAIIFEPTISHRFVAVVMGSTYDGRFTDMESIVRAVQERVASGK